MAREGFKETTRASARVKELFSSMMKEMKERRTSRKTGNMMFHTKKATCTGDKIGFQGDHQGKHQGQGVVFIHGEGDEGDEGEED